MGTVVDYNAFDKHVVFRKKPGKDVINDLCSNKADLLHMVVGLVTETHELDHNFITNESNFDLVNFEEECGDIFYYTRGAMGCLPDLNDDIDYYGRGFDFTVKTIASTVDQIRNHAILALDDVKSYAIYGKDTDELVESILTHLYSVQRYTEELIKVKGSSVERVLECNIHKLSIRYPNGYTNKKAISRDDKVAGE